MPVTVRRDPLPTVSLVAPPDVDQCVSSSGSSVTLAYQATATAAGAGVLWTVSAVTNVAGVTCTDATGTGEHTDNLLPAPALAARPWSAC